MDKSKIAWSKIFMISAYFLSALLILVVYFSNRSLFLDSLNLARNIAERTFSELANPLNYEQSAPLLFLFISKMLTLIFGVSEFSLRILPLFAGLGSLALFGIILNHFLKSHYVIIGILWMGTHAMYVNYATEFKQYITDVFVSTFLFWITLKIKEVDNKNLITIGLIGSIAIWLSMPAIFGILGVLAYYYHIHQRSNKSKLPLTILAFWFAINFALEYFLILKPAILSDHMQNFHQTYFIQGSFWKLESLKHDLGLIVSTIRLSVGKSGLTISLAILLIGTTVYNYICNRNNIGLLTVIPIIAVFGASLIGKYSLIERLMLFTMPLVFFLILMGSQLIEESLKSKSKWLKYSIFGVLMLGLIVGINQTNGLQYFTQPFDVEDNRTALLHINQHKSHANTIVCSQFAFPAYEYYTKYDINYQNLNLGKAKEAHFSDDLIQLALDQSKSDKNSVWVLLAHMTDAEISNHIEKLDKVGSIKNSYRTNRSAAILFSTQ